MDKTSQDRIDRIDEILESIKKFWIKHPDWRLGQLIFNLSPDPFYMGDDNIEIRIEFIEKVLGDG